MRRRLFLILASCALALSVVPDCACGALPLEVTFQGRAKFDQLVAQAPAWKPLPIGERVAAVGRALAGTPYKSSTLEIDDRVESPSVNFNGLDCWTLFETALAFARMLDEPADQWTPETLLRFVELDRYRAGQCTGSYLSRLHYLEDWLRDNARRGLVADLTPALGGVRVPHSAVEMSVNWRSYRYLRNNPALRPGIRAMEENVSRLDLLHIPKERVPGIESQLHSGDIIGITTFDGGKIGTSHVGLAVRLSDGVHFLHASSPRNYGKVVLDARLSDYLKRYRTDAGILVARPLR